MNPTSLGPERPVLDRARGIFAPPPHAPIELIVLGHRRSIRRRSFDYSGPGAYYVTLRVEGAVTAPLQLSRITDGCAELNRFGTLVDMWWHRLPERFVGITLDEHIVMPDHFHGIIVIEEPRPLEVRSTLGQMIAWFKYNSTKEINAERGTKGLRVWQRNYWERIIRDECERDTVRRYIRENPARWATHGSQQSRGR